MKTSRKIRASSLCLMVLAVLTVPVAQALRSESAVSWTLMVYMDGDNNLDTFAYYSLGLMEEVGSTQNVNVVVLWDGYYQPAYLYKVIKGGIEEVKGFPLNGKEVNMGDPSTLKTFVDFAVAKFSAQHYVLMLWDHGDDVSGICWDDHSNDHLTHPEVALALSKLHIDILAFDACLMAMIEVAYEYNQYGLSNDYLVGCENYVPIYGYPYNTILVSLNQSPAMSELQVAQLIVNEYAEFYQPRPHFNGGVMGTLSAIDIYKADELVTELGVMTTALTANMEENHEIIGDARGEGMLPWSEYGWELYIDLPTFTQNIALTTSDAAVKSAGYALLNMLSQAIVALGNAEPMESAEARGMGIWFPSSYHSMWGLMPYTATKFASEGWLDFLYAYWNDYHD